MVRTLISDPGCRHLHTCLLRVLTAVSIALLISTPALATERLISLRQGTAFTVTAPATGNQIAFDLAGQIWLTSDTNRPATTLAKSSALKQRPAFSHDGRYIAYESMLSGYRQIFVTDIENGTTRQMTFGKFDHLAPAWSPASSPRSRLVMATNRAGTFDIWEVDTGNLELRQLTFSAGEARDPAWNDDGTRLAYVVESTQGSSLYILTPGTKPQQVKHEQQPMHAPAWRPGGGLITYTRRSGQDSQLRMLILSTPAISKSITRTELVSARPVHWLDSRHFLYTADGKIRRRELGLPVFADVPFHIKIKINHDARSARKTEFADMHNRPVRGSSGQTERPDGRRVIAVLGDLWEFQHEDNAQLTLVRQLTNDAYVDAQPMFSPDGQHLAFISDRSGSPQVWIMEHASLDIRRLTRDRNVIGFPAWNTDGKSVAYLVADNQHGYRLRLTGISSKRSQALAVTSQERGWPIITKGTWAINSEQEAAHTIPVTGDRQQIPLGWQPAVTGERYLIRAGRVFDGLGPGYAARQEIVIENNLIVAIRPWSNTDTNMPIIDASKHTVIPGLIDMAVRQRPIDTERDGRKWLAAGVTTIRQTVDITNQASFSRAIEQQESWSSGRRIGPRLMITARPCDNESGRFDEPSFAQVVAETTPLNIAAIELCPATAGKALTDTIKQAHEHGLSVIATTPVPGISLGADELHPDSLSLTGSLQPDTIWQDFLLIASAAGARIPSRLVTASGWGNPVLTSMATSWQYQKIFTPAERLRFDASWRQRRTPGHSGLLADPNRILGAGGRIILGSETPVTPQGLGLHSEMRVLAARSLQPFQILKMVSLDAASLLGFSRSLGQIRIGRQADMVIINGDPLNNIDAIANVAATITNGRYYSSRDLAVAGRRGLAQKLPERTEL